jgi:hypothetical protein
MKDSNEEVWSGSGVGGMEWRKLPEKLDNERQLTER